MTLPTVRITGRCPIPNNLAPASAVIEFQLSGFDTDAANLVLPVTLSFDLINGVLPLDAELWPNTEGLRGTYYAVQVKVGNETTDKKTPYRLPNIQVAASPANQDLTGLLNNPVPNVASWNVNLESGAAADLIASVEANRVAISALNQLVTESPAIINRDPTPTLRGAPLKSTTEENEAGTAANKFPDVVGVREIVAAMQTTGNYVPEITFATTQPDIDISYASREGWYSVFLDRVFVIVNLQFTVSWTSAAPDGEFRVSLPERALPGIPTPGFQAVRQNTNFVGLMGNPLYVAGRASTDFAVCRGEDGDPILEGSDFVTAGSGLTYNLGFSGSYPKSLIF